MGQTRFILLTLMFQIYGPTCPRTHSTFVLLLVICDTVSK